MKRNILITGKVITFLGIALCIAFMAYILVEGDYEVHVTEHTVSMSAHESMLATWLTLSPFVTLGVGSILWSIGQRKASSTPPVEGLE